MIGRLINAALVAVIFLALAVASGRAYDQSFALREGEPSAIGAASAIDSAVIESVFAPVAVSAVQPASPSLSASRAASIRAVRLVFGSRAPAALRVVSCETGGTFNARALGRAGERGLFQIHPVHFSWAQPWRLFDPVWNSRVAYRLSRGGTRWGAWSCGWAA